MKKLKRSKETKIITVSETTTKRDPTSPPLP